MMQMWQRYFLSFLNDQFDQSKKANPSFSLRSFAKKLHLSPGMLSEILNGHRRLTKKTAEKIIENTKVTDSEKRRLAQMIGAEPIEARVLLPEEAYELESRWYYSAILCLFDLDDPPNTKEAIAERLNLPIDLCDSALDHLKSFGFLKLNENNQLESTKQYFKTSEDIPNTAFKQCLSEHLKQAQIALTDLPIDQRELTSVTFDGSSEGLLFAKEEIRNFRDKMVSVMQGPKRDHVYALNIQLIPLSKNMES